MDQAWKNVNGYIVSLGIYTSIKLKLSAFTEVEALTFTEFVLFCAL